MDSIISQIEQFILKNAWGVIFAGAIASILGTLFCYLFRKLRNYLIKKFKIRRNKQKTLRYMKGYYRGAAACLSTLSSYRQVILVGDYILDAFKAGLRIIVYFFVASIFIIMSNNLILDMFIIFICSFMIYPQYKRLKEVEMGYELTFDHVFGKDFAQKCVEGAMDSLKKNKDNHQESEDEPGQQEQI